MDASNRNTALASAMVEELARCGVRHAAISPGSRSTPIALALLRAPAIETVSVVDERSAAFFALGAAQATGKPAVVSCTSGTAAANLHPAICEASEAAVPLVALTADRPPELRDVGAGQTIDQLHLYGSAVRWFCEVGTQEAGEEGLLHLRSVACRAYAVARGDPRPGPVHLNLSWRDPLGPDPRTADVAATSRAALKGRGERPLSDVLSPPSTPDEALIADLAARLAAAPRGLIVAGRNPDPAPAAAIAGLARATGYPILAEPTSQLRLGRHDRGRLISSYEPIARAAPAALAPELVIRFGELPTSKPLRRWLARLDTLRQIVVDPCSGWSDPTRRAETVVRAGPAALAAALAASAGDADPGWWPAWEAAAAAAERAIDDELSAAPGLNEPAVHRALGRLYGDGEIVYTGSSMPIRDQEAFLRPAPADVRFLANRGANGIDGLVSSGIGAAAAGGRPTWIVTGDLGLHHDMNGLAILREVTSPVRLVVIDNDGGGIFEHLPQASQVSRGEFEALFGTPLGLDLERVARLYDIPFARADRLNRLDDLDTTGTILIEVPTDRRSDAELRGRIATRATNAVRDAAGG